MAIPNTLCLLRVISKAIGKRHSNKARWQINIFATSKSAAYSGYSNKIVRGGYWYLLIRGPEIMEVLVYLNFDVLTEVYRR